MEFKKAFRTVSRRDKLVLIPPPLAQKDISVDIRSLKTTNSCSPRLLVSAPKSFGSAPDRNHFKRIVRHAFLRALSQHTLSASWVVWVRPLRHTKNTTPPIDEITQYFVNLIKRLN